MPLIGRAWIAGIREIDARWCAIRANPDRGPADTPAYDGNIPGSENTRRALLDAGLGQDMSAPLSAVPSSVNGWNAEYLDSQYEQYRRDPQAVSPELRAFFQGFELAREGAAEGDASPFQAIVGDLIEAYRTIGHIAARTDPFGRVNEPPPPLTLEYYGLGEKDLDRPVDASSVGLDGVVPLRRLIEHLQDRYCGTIGVEVMHVTDAEERNWLLDRFERGVDRSPLTRGEKMHLLQQLLNAERFEQFLGKRYPGEKRFSLEGSESLIPLLDRCLEHATDLGVEEVVIGMAHRGRLNVLNNIMGKTHEQIFTEFEDTWTEDFADGGGDVKYHRGYSSERTFPNGKTLHLALASNPSHLEFVDPVVLGRCRAKQRLRSDEDRRRVITLLIHGDAALPGQGVASETLNLSQLEGYTVGGTVHVVVNNLIGFTTGPEDARSSRYCTDIAKFIEAPVLHVNGEDPEAVLACAHFAIEYRQKFKKDIFIDLLCYRKYGHNEQDEASFTQPILYKLIKAKPSVLESYAQKLLAEGVISEEDIRKIDQSLREALDEAQRTAKEKPRDPTIDPGSARWSGLQHRYSHEDVDTSVTEDALREVCRALSTVPEGFKVHRKLQRLLRERGSLLEDRKISYADAESLAFGTLLIEGYPIRLTGQDSERGTFSHRHAVLRDQETAEPYIPLNHIRPKFAPPDLRQGPETAPDIQARFCVHNSPLSEAGVLGYEYGYSLADPNMLVMWEAQFGDFCNSAQVHIDQFIASAEVKWQRWSGLVLLLPHGYEGAGPEHSSARLERFLQLFGDDNIQVLYPSTAAQAFHMFRRQMKRSFRKPLVVMTPKSMLRVPTSTIDELLSGRFHESLDDPRFSLDGADRSKVRRIVLCTGKIYHELAHRRDERGDTDLAIIRIEQLAPLRDEQLREIIDRYPSDASVTWVQEEPRNMGAYIYIADRLRTLWADHDARFTDLPYIGRPESATPAPGSKKLDRTQQEQIITEVVGPSPKADQKTKPQSVSAA